MGNFFKVILRRFPPCWACFLVVLCSTCCLAPLPVTFCRAGPLWFCVPLVAWHLSQLVVQPGELQRFRSSTLLVTFCVPEFMFYVISCMNWMSCVSTRSNETTKYMCMWSVLLVVPNILTVNRFALSCIHCSTFKYATCVCVNQCWASFHVRRVTPYHQPPVHWLTDGQWVCGCPSVS